MPENDDSLNVIPIFPEAKITFVVGKDSGSDAVLDEKTADQRVALLAVAQFDSVGESGEAGSVHPLIQHWLAAPREDVHDFEAVSRDIATLFEAFQYGMLDDFLSSKVVRTRSERGLFFRDVFQPTAPLSSNRGECRTLSIKARLAIVQKYPELRKNILIVHGLEPRYFNASPAQHVYLMMVDGAIEFNGKTFDGSSLPENLSDPRLDVELRGKFWILDPSFGFAGRPNELCFQERGYECKGVLPFDDSMRHLMVANDDRDAGNRFAFRVGSMPLARLGDGRVILLGVRGTKIRSLSDIGIGFHDPGRDYAEAIPLDHWEVEVRLKDDPTVLVKIKWLRNKFATEFEI